MELSLSEAIPKSKSSTCRCMHFQSGKPSGLALISIGNTLRSDDGIASRLCQTLPRELFAQICYFDLGTYTSHLPECFSGHSAAIIVDCTKSGMTPAAVSVINLLAVLERPSLLMAESSHGFSFFDELRFYADSGDLPSRLLFFGVEAASLNWSEELSQELLSKTDVLAEKLSLLVRTVLEELRANA